MPAFLVIRSFVLLEVEAKVRDTPSFFSTRRLCLHEVGLKVYRDLLLYIELNVLKKSQFCLSHQNRVVKTARIAGCPKFQALQPSLTRQHNFLNTSSAGNSAPFLMQ
jgi:hypothetical protein